MSHLPQEDSSSVLYPESWPEIPHQLEIVEEESFTDGSTEFTFDSTIYDVMLRISGPHDNTYTISVKCGTKIHDVYCQSKEKFIETLTPIYTLFRCDQIVRTVFGSDIGSFVKGINFTDKVVYALTDSLQVITKPFEECVIADFRGFSPISDSGGKLRLHFRIFETTPPNANTSEVYVFDNYYIKFNPSEDRYHAAYIPSAEVGVDRFVRYKQENNRVTVEAQYVDTKFSPTFVSEFI